MSTLRASLAVLLILITVLAVVPPLLISAHPANWYTPAQVTQSLTKGTPDDLNDDDAADFVHQIQWANVPGWDEGNWTDAADANGNGTAEVAEILAWIIDNVANGTDWDNYGIDDAWANPEQTLNLMSGDIEDRAFLLASLIKWHSGEANVTEGDLVYVLCVYAAPPIDLLEATVLWYDASEDQLNYLDLTGLLLAQPPDLPFGAALLNDEHIVGYLPGYYPGPVNPLPGYEEDDFGLIAAGGLGEPMNNYAWSLGNLSDELFVGTGRNIPYMVGLVLKDAGWIPGDMYFDPITHPREPAGTQEWADDMRAEIWRYGSWERVYQSPTVNLGGPIAPREMGIRKMMGFDGELYAVGGEGMVPGSLMLKSANGADWQPVVTPLAMGTDSRAMIVHNGKLYVGTSGGGNATVWSYDGATWTKVADFTPLAQGNNAGVTSLETFNGYLYAGTSNVMSGYQVFRSNAQAPNDPQLGQWTRVVEYGGGDMMNYFAGTMEVFDNHLYVGSMSLPVQVNGEPQLVPAKGFELIRIATDDTWELVIGDYAPVFQPPGGAQFRVPRSGWPDGFANPFNFYCWSMLSVTGNPSEVLYLGTFDATSFLSFLPIDELFVLGNVTPEEQDALRGNITEGLQCAIALMELSGFDEYYIQPLRDLLEVFQAEPFDWQEAWKRFTDLFAGADLWKTNDGIRWEPVTLNGFGNPSNYGFREMLYVNPMYIGTANPFTGLEVFRAPPPPPPEGNSTDQIGFFKDEFWVDEGVYGKGMGFPPGGKVDVYITPDLTWTDGMRIPDDVSGDGVNVVDVDLDGNIAVAEYWPPPCIPGGYDIVFDANRNGYYDVGGDYVDHPNHPGFIIRQQQWPPPNVPAVSLWGSAALAVVLAGTLAWSMRRRLTTRVSAS